MITAELAQREIATGLSAVCAWCERYWEGKARARGGAHACAVPDCGGPGVGRAFPRYRGPRPHKAAYCFVCGDEAHMAVEFHGPGGGMVGCCAAHEPLLRKILTQRPGAPLVVQERLVAAVAAGTDPVPVPGS